MSRTRRPKTIDQWSRHLARMHEGRNQFNFSTVSHRIGSLQASVHALRACIRAKKMEVVPSRLAVVFERLMAVRYFFQTVDEGRGLPLSQAIAAKYSGPCKYCRKPSCVCEEVGRNAPTLKKVSSAKSPTIQRLAKRLAKTYSTKNAQSGDISRLLSRLSNEVSELQVLSLQELYGLAKREEYGWNFALEVADVLAWLLAVANFFGTDLQTALEACYGEVCFRCRHASCRCSFHVLFEDTV